MTQGTRPAGRGEIVLAGALLTVLAMLGWLVTTIGAVSGVDDGVRRWVLSAQLPLLRVLLKAVTFFGNAMIVMPLFLLGAGVVSWFRGTAEPAVSALTGAGLLLLSVGTLKAVVGRMSPSGEPVEFLSGAWPSGHTATATVVYGLIALRLHDSSAGARRNWVRALVGLPVLIALALVYSDFHWLSDVVGGYLLGVLVLLATSALTRRAPRSRESEPPPARPTASQNRP